MTSGNRGRLEFVQTAQAAFAYLVDEFGFHQEPVADETELAVAFSNGRTRVVVEGRDWGLNARVAFGNAAAFENFDLADLISLRRTPAELRPERGSLKRGSRQLDQVRYYAEKLRAIGADILRGDRTVFEELQGIVDKRAEAFRRAEE